MLKSSSNLWWNPKHCSLAVLYTFHSVHHPIHEPRIFSFHYLTEIKKFKQVVRKKTEIKAYICNKRLPPGSTLYKATDTAHEHNWNSKSSSKRLSTKTPTIKLPHGKDSDSILAVYNLDFFWYSNMCSTVWDTLSNFFVFPKIAPLLVFFCLVSTIHIVIINPKAMQSTSQNMSQH